jgi:dipeptidyl aminopeptidase/acylaminoacyl peptidase
MRTGWTRTSVLALVLLALPALAPGATRYDPRLRFRTYRTRHFDIHAHQGEEALARRLTAIAEHVRSRFEATLGVPRGRVQVILVDQSDVSNGWATPLPYDTIEISAVPPIEEELIGNTTDWLELALTHEYTHILHLDRSRGFMDGVRRVFGRAPLVFPNAFLPIWQIEGLATYEESRQTGEGRIPAGDFRAIVDTAARQRRFAPIDRASGGLDDWPGGNAAYAYGAYFHQYLSDRYGADRIDALADATAGRLPLFGAGAFRTVFGVPQGALWREFQASREDAAAPPSVTDASARRLTRDGFVAAAPRVGADGAIYYRTSNADGFPALIRLEGDSAHWVAWRALGDRTSLSGDWVVFDQVELVRSVATVSDLYAVPRRGGAVVRLTREARAEHPDVSPDGRRIACVLIRPGRRALALVDFDPHGRPAEPRVLVDDPASDFSGPRWAPDGRQFVAERRYEGRYELVLVDAANGAVRPIVSRADARVITPSWSPDGGTIFFAADPGDEPFNVFALDLTSGAVRQVTDSRSGAQSPEILPDGSLVYVGYSTDGYDLYSIPPAAVTRSAGGSRLPAGEARTTESAGSADEEPPGLSAGAPYRPLRTLAPTYWTPVVTSDGGETLIGAGTGMSDALGRHSYSARAAWSASRARPDWQLAYAYDRWRPTLVANYSDDTNPIAGGELRSRELFAGVLLPFRRLRWEQTLMTGVDAERDTASCTVVCRSGARDVRSLRSGWLFDSRRLYGYSISPEEGAAIEVAVEGSRGARGLDAQAGTAIFDARAFHRLFSRHTVVAVRLAAAASTGDPAAERVFSAAGSGAPPPAFSFGRDAIGLLRGFSPEDLIGTRAAVLNVDLRVPIVRVQRGAGTLPFFARSLHGAAFVDAGTAWTGAFHAADLRRAIGGELSLDSVVVYSLRLTLAGGASWTHDPVAGRDRAAVFARFGYAF